MGLTVRDPDEEFDAWLLASCQSQGVPLTLADPEVIETVRVLLKFTG